MGVPAFRDFALVALDMREEQGIRGIGSERNRFLNHIAMAPFARKPLDFAIPLGEGYHDHAYDEHKQTCRLEDHDDCEVDAEPPKGDGWQLWQTVSDGPISPVFATPEELIEFMCQPVPLKDRPSYEPSAFPRNPWAQGWQRATAESFVKREGWAPSFIVMGGKPLSAAEAEELHTAGPKGSEAPR